VPTNHIVSALMLFAVAALDLLTCCAYMFLKRWSTAAVCFVCGLILLWIASGT